MWTTQKLEGDAEFGLGQVELEGMLMDVIKRCDI